MPDVLRIPLSASFNFSEKGVLTPMGDEPSVSMQLVQQSGDLKSPLLSLFSMQCFWDESVQVLPNRNHYDLSQKRYREKREKSGDFNFPDHCTSCVAFGSSSPMKVNTVGTKGAGNA